MSAVAAVDCGTNSIRLLIAEPAEKGPGLVDVERRTEIVRLGQGVDATGEFHPDALRRTFAAVDQYSQLIDEAGVPTDRIHFVATSASRDARNRDEFFAGVQQRLGVLPDVISGDREAQLSFTGALSQVRPEFGPVLVMDIGGGSTEFIVGTVTGEMTSAISLDIGSVRMTERFLKKSPPEPEVGTGGGSVRGRATGPLRGPVRPDRQLDRGGRHRDHAGRGLSGAARVRPDEGARLDHSPRGDQRLVRSAERARRRGDQGAALDAGRPRRRHHRRGPDREPGRGAAPVPELVISESDILDGIALAAAS